MTDEEFVNLVVEHFISAILDTTEWILEVLGHGKEKHGKKIEK